MRNRKLFFQEGERLKGTLVLVTQVDWPSEIVASTDDEWVARYDKAWSLIEDSNLTASWNRALTRRFRAALEFRKANSTAA